MINDFVWNLILVPNSVAFISQNEKNVCFFYFHLVSRSVRKMVLMFDEKIDMCLLYKCHQIAHLVSYLINHFSKWMLPCSKKMLLNFEAKMKFFYIIKWLIMAIL